MVGGDRALSSRGALCPIDRHRVPHLAPTHVRRQYDSHPASTDGRRREQTSQNAAMAMRLVPKPDPRRA
jgi:hypothetical protein